MRPLRRDAAFLWIEPRLAARSSALCAAFTASVLPSPPAAIAVRAVRTAVRAAERPACFVAVRRTVWRIRLRAERLRFLTAIGDERSGIGHTPLCSYSVPHADVDRAGVADHDRDARGEPLPWLAAALRHRRPVRWRREGARRVLGRFPHSRHD